MSSRPKLNREVSVYSEVADVGMFMQSTSVVSGSGKGVVVATGAATYIASLARALPSGRTASAFDYAVRRIVYLFIAFIIVMVPLVIVLSGTTTGKPHVE